MYSFVDTLELKVSPIGIWFVYTDLDSKLKLWDANTCKLPCHTGSKYLLPVPLAETYGVKYILYWEPVVTLSVDVNC